VVMVDQANDTAILTSDLDRKLEFLTLAGRDPIVGEPIMMIGFPRGLAKTVTQGHIGIGEMPDEIFFDGKRTALWHDRVMFDMTGAPGNSGSPVLNARGQVIAYLNAGSSKEPMGFGMMAYIVREMLAEYRANGAMKLPATMLPPPPPVEEEVAQ